MHRERDAGGRAQNPTAETSKVHALISILATADGAEWELADGRRALADQAKEDGSWHPNDPMSVRATPHVGVRNLPIVDIDGHPFYRDDRLSEYRAVDNPHHRRPL